MFKLIFKGLVPAGILFALLPVETATAAACPAGQMYRVSLKKCVAKAGGNVQFLRRAAKPEPARARKVAAKPEIRARAPETDAEETIRTARVTRATPVRRPPDLEPAAQIDQARGFAPTRGIVLPFEGNSGAPAQQSWPYGALR